MKDLSSEAATSHMPERYAQAVKKNPKCLENRHIKLVRKRQKIKIF
jgi:hypothetical protein